MALLRNHPGMFLNDPAAASLERFEADHGVQPITDAGRLESTQQGYIDRWNRGGVYNRPPYLYEPKRPARDSDHVKNGGEAIDTTNWRYWRQHAGEYGWVVDYDWDVVHFRYDIRSDRRINYQTIEIKPKEWDEMASPAEIRNEFKAALDAYNGAPRTDAVLISYASDSDRNGVVLAAPGFWKKLTYEELVQMTAHNLRPARVLTPVNDRDYDVFRAIYTQNVVNDELVGRLAQPADLAAL